MVKKIKNIFLILQGLKRFFYKYKITKLQRKRSDFIFMTKGRKGKLKDIDKEFVSEGYKLIKIGMEDIGEIDISTDIDFYNYLIYQNKKQKIRIDFDIINYSYDWQNWGVVIIDVEIIKL